MRRRRREAALMAGGGGLGGEYERYQRLTTLLSTASLSIWQPPPASLPERDELPAATGAARCRPLSIDATATAAASRTRPVARSIC